jgi:hypothetical protein
MPDEKWLWDQPASWHAMNRSLHDIGVLLNYLTELPDSRLLSYFKATRESVTDGVPRNTAPPCDSYALFLDRLDAIAAAFQTGRRPPDPPPGSPGSPVLGPVAFVDWSRDFLAAVAAPATASSIRLTREYGIQRSNGLRARFGKAFAWVCSTIVRQSSEPALLPLLPADPEEEIHRRFARRLARWVQRFEWATVGMVVFTLLVSIYALSGRLILTNEGQMRDAWAKLDALVEAQEDKAFQTPTLPISEKSDFHVSPLCELVREEPVRVQVAAADSTQNPEGSVRTETRSRYLSARQAHLCDQRAKVTQDLFVVTMHLQFWSSVIAKPHDAFWSPGGLPIRNPFWPAAVFGVDQNTLEQVALERKGELCNQLVPRPDKYQGGDPDACKTLLWTLIDRSRNAAESILGSITQYVLPVCYGLLGAMAAALRLIRRKVDAATLVPTDRARLQQGAILGVLCGAVIGLFANQVGGAESAGGLGLSALALIAGYNVDGVFRFLDELSDRIFGAAAKAK